MGDIDIGIKRIIVEVLEPNPDKITSEAKFIDELGKEWPLEILAAIEKK